MVFWVDSSQDDCASYVGQCADYGHTGGTGGLTANQACCICGGGVSTGSVPCIPDVPEVCIPPARIEEICTPAIEKGATGGCTPAVPGTCRRSTDSTCGGLEWRLFYGVEASFRVQQIVTPDAWAMTSLCATAGYPCFGGLKLVCLTSSDSYYGGMWSGTTSIKTAEAQCADQTGTYCSCLQYDSAASYVAERLFSANTDVVYWLKYPKTGVVTVVPETEINSGCLTFESGGDSGGGDSGGVALWVIVVATIVGLVVVVAIAICVYLCMRSPNATVKPLTVVPEPTNVVKQDDGNATVVFVQQKKPEHADSERLKLEELP